MPKNAVYLLEKNGFALDDLTYFIGHQANMRIMSNIAKQLNLPEEKFLHNIEELGNTGSVSSALVYAQNDRMAAGAYAAAARKGREKEMRFIGIDALPGKDYGVEKVLAGELDATFIYPTGGDRVMQIAMDILNKRDFPRETILGTSVVDRDNALIMKMQTAHIGTLDGKIEP